MEINRDNLRVWNVDRCTPNINQVRHRNGAIIYAHGPVLTPQGIVSVYSDDKCCTLEIIIGGKGYYYCTQEAAILSDRALCLRARKFAIQLTEDLANGVF